MNKQSLLYKIIEGGGRIKIGYNDILVNEIDKSGWRRLIRTCAGSGKD